MFLLLLSTWGIFFLSQKTVDGVCLAAATYLALLQKGFSFALAWPTDAAEQTERSSTGCDLQVALHLHSHRGPACLCCSTGLRRGQQGTTGIIIFFSLKNPTNSSICLQRKCSCSDVGCCSWPTAWPAPRSSARTQCFLYIYLYLYISIYIFICFSFPSLSSVTVRRSWDVGVESENPERRPLLNGSLAWVGPETPASLHRGQDSCGFLSLSSGDGSVSLYTTALVTSMSGC